MKKRSFSLFSAAVLAFQAAAVTVPCLAIAASVNPDDDTKSAIGRITYLDRQYWGMRLSGAGGDRDAAVNGKVYEHDLIQTIAHQHLVVLLEDGTELLIGPSSRIFFKNWRGRNSQGRRVRSLVFTTGMLKAKVRKIYSQEEPFLVESKNGVVGVRGTEFVVEAGSGGRLGRLALTSNERATRNAEIEVHTLEGEVYLARTLVQLQSADTRVSINAGQTSLVRTNMTVPQAPHEFDVARFTAYLTKASPGVQISVVKNTTNAQRAEMATNIAGKASTSSPALPTYAKTNYKVAPARSIASAPPGILGTVRDKLDSDEHDRRKETGFDADGKAAVAVDPSGVTTDGVHQAFQGAEQGVTDGRNSGDSSLAAGARINTDNQTAILNKNAPSPIRIVPRSGAPRAGGG